MELSTPSLLLRSATGPFAQNLPLTYGAAPPSPQQQRSGLRLPQSSMIVSTCRTWCCRTVNTPLQVHDVLAERR